MERQYLGNPPEIFEKGYQKVWALAPYRCSVQFGHETRGCSDQAKQVTQQKRNFGFSTLDVGKRARYWVICSCIDKTVQLLLTTSHIGPRGIWSSPQGQFPEKKRKITDEP